MTVGAQHPAVVYASRYNWHIIPVWHVRPDGSCGCGDPHVDNRANIGKHPVTALAPNGIKDATSDPTIITRWFEAAPDANVAVVCAPSGLVVVDVDPRHGGDASWDAIESQHDVPATLRAKTGGGGFHLFFRASPGVRYRGRIAQGVDVKHNGYVLVAPSNHVLGEYAWQSSGVEAAELGPLRALVEIGPGQSGGVLDSSGSALDFDELFAGVPEGRRHDTFKSWCASMRARKLKFPEAKALVELAVAAAGGGRNAFTLDEALPILVWAYTELPEGTTAEHELEQYTGFLKSVARQELEQSGGQANGVTPHVTILERIQRLPDALRDGVVEELRRRDVRSEAARIMNAVDFHPPVGGRLDELIARGAPDPVWTISGLHELGTNMTLTAQFKAGKTTFQMNMLKALADGERFLGVFDTFLRDGAIAFYNYELTEAQCVRWLTRLRVIHPERVHVLNMRGYKLDIGDPYAQEWVIEWLRSRNVKFWFVDPLARAYYGDENDNTQLKLWTDSLDWIKQEAGVRDCLISLHTGRGEQEEGQERARGATRIDDWADGRILITRQAEHRFMRAEGREIDVAESLMVFNPETWQLQISNLTPVDRRTMASLDGIRHVIEACHRVGATSRETAQSKSSIRNAIRAGRIIDRARWIDSAVTTGDVQADEGARGGTVLWVQT